MSHCSCVLLFPLMASFAGNVLAQSQRGEPVIAADALSVVAVLKDDVALNEAHDVELQGEYAFVAGKGNAVAIIDVSIPNRPRLVWHLNDPERLHDSETVLVDGDRLFLGTDDFHSIDVADPSQPRFDATIVDPQRLKTINGMARRGDTLFAASKEGFLTAIDVSEPAMPAIAGVVETKRRHGIAFPHDVDLYESFAVVVDPNGFGLQPGNLALFRVFDDAGELLPDAQWQLVGRASSEALSGANRVQVRGDFAFVGGSYFPKVSQGRALAKGIVVDLSDPTQPRDVATVDFPDLRGPNGLTIAGDVWFLAGGQTVQAYDIRDPTRPRLLASFKSTTAFPTADDNAHDLVYRDGYLYVTSQGDHGLVILRVNVDVFRKLASSDGQSSSTFAPESPNIILLMADDQGWGQTGYYGHPILQTPNMDAMAANGLRFDRFYAGAPNCSPTRATVLTGRSNDRTGVLNHGYPLNIEEQALGRAFRDAGYATAHFGKWHLNGLRGPGVPILKDDPRHPGRFGFDNWLSATNYFDLDPLLSRNGEFVECRGDSSEVIIAEAIKFIRRHVECDQPFLTVIWYGTPHSPWRATDRDRRQFSKLSTAEQNHYGELVAMDSSIGTLRQALRELQIAADTLVWFCSDNGGLQPFGPSTVGGLRGWKNTMYEGGLRVPAIVEWPGGIGQRRVTAYPASTLDIFPTLVDIAGLDDTTMLQPQDGVSLKPLFASELKSRDKPIPFRHQGRAAVVDNEFKLFVSDLAHGDGQLFHLADDPAESIDVSERYPEVARRLNGWLEQWNHTVEASMAGNDYGIDPSAMETIRSRFWMADPAYEPFLEEWILRPEYSQRIKKSLGGR